MLKIIFFEQEEKKEKKEKWFLDCP